MESFTPKSAVVQLADHLRGQILSGDIGETMPGINQLVRELGMGTNTVLAAVASLEKEGLLENRGGRRSRRILRDAESLRTVGLKVRILLYEPSDRKTDYLVELVHLLGAAGHKASFAAKTMRCLGMDQKRIARFVEVTEADAWVVVAGSRALLEWFHGRMTPTFALFGRHRKVPLAAASVDKVRAYHDLVDRLVSLGHRRIVNVVREDRRKPAPGFLECLFLERLSHHGIQTGAYNMPDWDDNPKGLHTLLDSLFRTTPPTALLLDEPMIFISARDHLARQGIIAPEKVSLAYCDTDTLMDWCLPQVTHIRWHTRPIIQRVIRWVDKIGIGRDDRHKSASKAHLFAGGTIGPAPGPSLR